MRNPAAETSLSWHLSDRATRAETPTRPPPTGSPDGLTRRETIRASRCAGWRPWATARLGPPAPVSGPAACAVPSPPGRGPPEALTGIAGEKPNVPTTAAMTTGTARQAMFQRRNGYLHCSHTSCDAFTIGRRASRDEETKVNFSGRTGRARRPQGLLRVPPWASEPGTSPAAAVERA